MKLGDNMAPIEACNVWNDVCPRKTRPPKIGDIPRHVAVDEESPGCSTSKSVVQVQQTTPKEKSMLKKSAGCPTDYEKSAASSTLPLVETFTKRPLDPSKKVDRVSRICRALDSDRAEDYKRSLNSNSPSILIGKIFNEPNQVSQTLKVEENLEALTDLQKNPCMQVLKSIGEALLSHEHEIPEEIIQVRKDSALYIDEKETIKAVELRKTLVALGVGPQSAVGISQQDNVQETFNSRLSRPEGLSAARRESSGYFSNVGTFDEDRLGSSTSDLVANHHDGTFSTRESLRERRRSSTKNRLPMGGGQQINRMTTLVCSINDENLISSSENDAVALTKTGRIDMPNIDEQPSLELNKSIELDPTCPDKEIGNDGIDLTKRISQVSLENLPSKTLIKILPNENLASIVKNNESLNDNVVTEELGHKLGNVDLGSQCNTSFRVANRQRNRMVVHQYSSPNMTNSELERIPERSNNENFVRSKTQFEQVNCSESVVNTQSRTGDCEEDVDEQVVTACLSGDDGTRQNEVDPRKLLPRSIKVYQLLSTQSEDRGDGDMRLFDRRISLQIARNEDEAAAAAAAARENACGDPLPMVCRNIPSSSEFVEEKKLVHADSVPIFNIPSTDASAVENESSLCTGGRFPSSNNLSGPATLGIRPIYPYCPYSPYASPQGSPRTHRRRPLRESRRVSIDSRQGALQLNQYKLLNNIGQGSYGIVKLAYNEEDGTHYAMKILSKKKLMKKAGIFGRIAPGRKGAANPLAKVYREIALLKKLDHPNVVKLVEVLDDPDEDNLYLVFELVQKGEVLQLPTDKPLDEETARINFRDVVMGVEYLHYQRIVHRDIKPSNLLVDSEGRVKVADLGVSAELRAAGELLSGCAGTPAFAAPETTTPGAQYSGTLCDVWSMGVTLYSLVTGKVPWDGAGSIIGVQSAVRSEPLRFPETPCLTEHLRHLISRMLSKDPARRITLAGIKEHSWITNKGKEPLPNEVDNCRLPVTVTDEEVARVVTRVPKLDTLILIKTMLKQHSFQNPFLPRKIVRSGCTTTDADMSDTILKKQVSSDTTDSSTELLPTADTLKSKTEQFHKAGRSNSAPDSYEWQLNGRQISSDALLPPVAESSSQEQAEVEKR